MPKRSPHFSNPGDDAIRRLERRVAAGDEDARLALVNEYLRRGDPRGVELWLSSRVHFEKRRFTVDDVRAVVGAVAKQEWPWAWLYAEPNPDGRDDRRDQDESIDRLIDAEAAGADLETLDLNAPTGPHNRWIFVLAVRTPDGRVTIGARERRTSAHSLSGGLDRSLYNLENVWPELSVYEGRFKPHIGRERQFAPNIDSLDIDIDLDLGGHYDGRNYLPTESGTVSAFEGGWKPDEDPDTGEWIPKTRPGTTYSRFVKWAEQRADDRIQIDRATAIEFAREFPQQHEGEDREPLIPDGASRFERPRNRRPRS